MLKECQVSEGTLIGFSMGGGEVARYMTKYNGAGLVQAGLIASIVPYKLKTPDNPHGSDEKLLDDTLAGIKEDRPKFFAEFFKKFYGVDRAEKPVSRELLQWSLNVTMQAGLKATLACAESFFKTDFRGDLPSFKVPTLIIHGDSDKQVPLYQAEIFQKKCREAKAITAREAREEFPAVAVLTENPDTGCHGQTWYDFPSGGRMPGPRS